MRAVAARSVTSASQVRNRTGGLSGRPLYWKQNLEDASGRGDRLSGKCPLKDAKMELFNEIQQLRTNAGSHKSLAVSAGRLHEPGMSVVQAASEYTISWRLFLTARGNLHEDFSGSQAHHDIKIVREKRINLHIFGFRKPEGWNLGGIRKTEATEGFRL